MTQKAVVFIGALESGENSVSGIISTYILNRLKINGVEAVVYNLAENEIPLLDLSISDTPKSVQKMIDIFLSADFHIWMAPLYHGSIPGSMKNCLDWLELTSGLPQPYLSDKVIGMICWADGIQSLNGINTMENIAKSLRAWALPYSVPVSRGNFLEIKNGKSVISDFYSGRLDLLVDLASSRRIQILPLPS